MIYENEMNFEKSLQELEGIVKSLESENLSLEEALSRFETGVKLSRQCHEYLKAAQRKVEILSEKSDGSQGAREPFEIEGNA